MVAPPVRLEHLILVEFGAYKYLLLLLLSGGSSHPTKRDLLFRRYWMEPSEAKNHPPIRSACSITDELGAIPGDEKQDSDIKQTVHPVFNHFRNLAVLRSHNGLMWLAAECALACLLLEHVVAASFSIQL